jgi:hypothetical protein
MFNFLMQDWYTARTQSFAGSSHCTSALSMFLAAALPLLDTDKIPSGASHTFQTFSAITFLNCQRWKAP